MRITESGMRLLD